MSSIASNAEDLILNADGGSSTVKIKINGTEKASISSAGAFTSTTIDATALTGNLPALNASALTNLDAADVSGTHTNFTSTGIDDNADATAMTIDSSERIGIGTTSPAATLHVKGTASTTNDLINALNVEAATTGSAANGVGTSMKFWGSMTGQDNVELGELGFHNNNVSGANGDFVVKTRPNGTLVERLRITSDGRGLSEFTAKAWASWNGSNTSTVRDSHNVSSVSDNGTGHYSMNFANNLANINYVAAGMSGVGHFMTNLNAVQSVGDITVYTTDHVGSNNDKPYNYLMVIGA